MTAFTSRCSSPRDRIRALLSFLKRRRRILLLDDDASIRRLVTALLAANGFRVDEVLTGAAAIEAIKRETFAVLILDLMMPHEGGVTVMRYLREQNPELLPRVIVLTGAPSAVGQFESEIGAVLRKPFDHQTLVATVERLSA